MKTILSFILTYLIRLTKYIEWFIHDNKIEKTKTINSLAPKILTETTEFENVKSYLVSLKDALDTESVNNIAITGGYGSGKSTILRTFQFHYKEYEYLPISLASFKENKEKRSELDDTSFERRLEVSVLQQMFYHVKPSRIPDSRFKRIINLTRKKLLLQILFIIIWLFCILFLVKFEYIENLNPRIWSLKLPFDWFTFLLIVFFFCGLAYFIKQLIRLLGNSKISKLNIKGELELGENVEKSVFNQHLEEILYFFERTKFNVVIIEDVDRFNSTDIFTKLREINILINNSEQVERKVKFIYAIRDDMFKDANDRVKFFDFIIPVIPFINPSNASDQLTKLIIQSRLPENTLSKEMREDVCAYINEVDMRLLVNIYNEFLQYRSKLPDSLSYDRMFSLIVYKNLFPDDFVLLSSNSGELYKIMSEKHVLIKSLTESITDESKGIDNLITKLEKENNSSIRELRMIYLTSLISNLPGFSSFWIDGSIQIEEALDDEHFNKLLISQNILYNRYKLSYGNYKIEDKSSSNISFSSIETTINPTLSYSERETIIRDNISGRTKSLKTQLGQLKDQKKKIESLSLKDLLSQINSDIYYGAYKNNYLIRYFLLNGLIDEEYLDYISVFHEISLTRKDLEFEKKIKAGAVFSYDYQLSNPLKVTRRIQERYFDSISVLNFHIMDSLLIEKNLSGNKIETFFNQLSTNRNTKTFEFITGYINSGTNQLPLFINLLIKKFPQFWIDLKENYNLPEYEILKYVKVILEYANPSDIRNLSKRISFDHFISELPDFIDFANSINNHAGFKSYIEEYSKISVKYLIISEADKNNYFEFVYEGSHYTLSLKNIISILEYYKCNLNEDQLRSAPLSSLYKLTEFDHLVRYIKDNPEIYLKNVVFIDTISINESDEVVLEILNSDVIKSEVKKQFANTQATKLKDLSEIIDFDIKGMTLSINKVVPNWENVIDYYLSTETFVIDEILLRFLEIEQNYTELAQQPLENTYSVEPVILEDFDNKLIHCNSLNRYAYQHILKSLKKKRDFNDLKGLTNEMVEDLIISGILSLSSRNITSLLGVSSNLHIKLIEENFDSFLSSYGDLDLDHSDWEMILKSSVLLKPDKIKIIQILDESIITDNNTIATLVCNLLPDDNLSTISFSMLQSLITSDTSIERKIAVLNRYITLFEVSEITELIDKLGDEYSKLFTGEMKLEFKNHQLNYELFSILKALELIQDVKLNDPNEKIIVSTLNNQNE